MKVPALLTCLLLLVLLPSRFFAQGWEKKFGSGIAHRGHYAQPTTDGGYILGASSQNADLGFYDDMQIIKTNATGDTLWTRAFDDVDVHFGRYLKQPANRAEKRTLQGRHLFPGGPERLPAHRPR